jgi:penicillin-binding protein 1A
VTGPGSVVAPPHLAMMNRMLEETLLAGTGQRAKLPGWPAAGKTGTSQDFRDAWFIGYTGHLLAGVWLGNDDNAPTKRASGSNLPVDIWNRFMRAAHRNVPVVGLPGASDLPGMPPSEVIAGDPARAQPSTGASLDNWLLDRLFSR